MDVYWSIERCGWVPCHGAVEPVATTWERDESRSPAPVPELPRQRADQQVPAER